MSDESKQPEFTLADFIQLEMKRRGMNVREFARAVGVAHSTISNQLTRRTHGARDDFLGKLSNYTGISMITLRALADIRYAERVGIPARTLLLAERFAKLPQELQDFIWGNVLGE